MPELKNLRDIARQALTIRSDVGQSDLFFLKCSERLIRSVECICMLPELKNSGFPIDSSNLTAAAYFNCAGLARYYSSNPHEKRSTLWDVNRSSLLDCCSAAINDYSAEALDEAEVKVINSIITESYANYTVISEAMILSDARNLDDIGAIGIFNEFSRFAFDNKSFFDALQNWQKKVDYRYWQARIKESFRFDSVRKLAQKRLSTTEMFMEQLKIEVEGNDLADLTLS